MWIESAVQVGDLPVCVSVERLDDQRREQTAAVLAWLTLEALTDAQGNSTRAWHEHVAEIVRDHVAFVIDDGTRPDDLGTSWWTEAIGVAFIQFVRHNELAESINRHVEVMRRLDRPFEA